MTNREIYGKTFKFSIMRMLCSALGLVVLIGLPVLVFFLTQNASDNVMVVATGVAFVLGCIAYWLIARYGNYLYLAGQIAMMEQGITEGKLPENVMAAGKAAVKGRFATATVYFALHSITTSITNEITRGINHLTDALSGGDANSAASAVGNTISAVIALVLEYVNYCSLAWVFHKKEQNAFKSTCDGAVIYFQNWKTLLKNMGKVIGISLLSLIIIGVPLCAASSAILNALHGASAMFAGIDEALVEAEVALPFSSLYVAGVIVGLIVWSVLHGALVKPYILVSVMRRYIEAGEANPPKIDIYGKLAGLSKSFKKAMGKAELPAGAAEA